jgi:predicted MFS family arabinose efflux permease
MEAVRQGLSQNIRQFSLLILINGFVGGMVGLERTLLPKLAQEDFKLASTTAILSFITVFGIVKAFANLQAGYLANRIGRKRLLVIGWAFGLPVPFMLMYAGSWGWVLAANVLLAVNQGLAWSSTVVMKIDLVGERRRGFAMGLNECAGYLSIGFMAWLTGWMAERYGIRPIPFMAGAAMALIGFAMSLFLVRDTRRHVALETVSTTSAPIKEIFREATWRHPALGSVTFAGLVNNLNDGLIWGGLPILLATRGFSISEIGRLAAVYPAVWGLGQLFTGALSDRVCKKQLLMWGMLLQALALLGIILSVETGDYVMYSVLLGVGTAMVYPTFLSTVAENTHPEDRAAALGVFRFWRDLGYAIGAVLTGLLIDLLNLETAVLAVAMLTASASLVIRVRMRC